jgi:hypothetical protein
VWAHTALTLAPCSISCFARMTGFHGLKVAGITKIGQWWNGCLPLVPTGVSIARWDRRTGASRSGLFGHVPRSRRTERVNCETTETSGLLGLQSYRPVCNLTSVERRFSEELEESPSVLVKNKRVLLFRNIPSPWNNGSHGCYSAPACIRALRNLQIFIC